MHRDGEIRRGLTEEVCGDVSGGGKAMALRRIGVHQLAPDVGVELLVERSNLAPQCLDRLGQIDCLEVRPPIVAVVRETSNHHHHHHRHYSAPDGSGVLR